MENPIETQTLFWILGGVLTIGGGLATFIIGQIKRVDDKKLSKDVFREFKEGNDAAHDTTHQGLTRIESTQAEIYKKLDEKQDKL